jgi:hypothetical protein
MRNARESERFSELFNGRPVVFTNESYEIASQLCEPENRNFISDLLNDLQRHHGLFLPNSILG